MNVTNLRWWGWGALDQSYAMAEHSTLWSILQNWLELPDKATGRKGPPTPLEEIALRPSRLDDPVLSSLHRLLGEEAVRDDKHARIEHTYGKSYRDLIRLQAGHVPRPPDAVVYPANPGQIASLLAWASDRDIILIPFGGGSSILGGVELTADERPTITLDMTHLNHVLSVDPVSRTARIQAGAMGPAIEAHLNPQGFTLGHCPESFEFSTLGGWIATRSVGQKGIGYGKIEKIVQSIRVVTPVGLIEAGNVPAAAVGPNLMDILFGSEGGYGIITEAAMRISPCPEVRDYRGILFRRLDQGIATYRDLVQSQEIHPSLVHLSDTFETVVYNGLNHNQQGLRKIADQIVERYLQLQGFSFAPSSDNILMLLGFEGGVEWVGQQWNQAMKICSDHEGVSIGRGIGQSWLQNRYKWPYLRDALVTYGVMVGQLKTMVTWTKLTGVYEATTSAIKRAIVAADGGPGYVMARIAYANEHSALLRFIFLGRQVTDADLQVKLAQSQAVKQAATEAILNAGGTLPYYQSIGREHAMWLEDEIGLLGMKAIRKLKQTLDPGNILHAGMLLRL